MNYTSIKFEQEGPLGILSLNRPKALNSLAPEMKTELKDCLQRATKNESLRVLILTGEGRAFSAGGDLHNFKKSYEAWHGEARDISFVDANLPKAFIIFPKPIIAAVNGPAVGFGLTVSLTCDIRIASDQSVFSCAFVRIGVTPEFGSSYFLPRLVGYGKAAELIMTAQTIDAAEALRIGLVNRVVPHAELMSAAKEMASTISQFPKEAIMMSKSLLRHGYHSTIEQSIEYEGLTFRHLMRQKAHYEMVCKTIEELSAARLTKER
jgi:enoyl-CoA hydratase/carnithine racemase